MDGVVGLQFTIIIDHHRSPILHKEINFSITSHFQMASTGSYTKLSIQKTLFWSKNMKHRFSTLSLFSAIRASWDQTNGCVTVAPCMPVSYKTMHSHGNSHRAGSMATAVGKRSFSNRWERMLRWSTISAGSVRMDSGTYRTVINCYQIMTTNHSLL